MSSKFFPCGFGLAVTTVVLSATALLAQDVVTLRDLEGHKVSATIVKAQVVRRANREVTTRHENSVTLVFEPQGRLTTNVKNIVHGPKGMRPGEDFTANHAIQRPSAMKARGGGAGVHVFENGTLTLMRTYATGGFMRKFEFKRTPGGFECTATETHARENGKGEIRLKSSTDGEMVTIVSSKQIDSSCKVTK
jgi:hypothetical protein